MSKGSNRRPEDAAKVSANWDAIFAPKIDYTKEEIVYNQKEYNKFVTRKWIYDGHDNHKNEDDYKCSNCGYVIELATYTDPNDIKCGCEE